VDAELDRIISSFSNTEKTNLMIFVSCISSQELNFIRNKREIKYNIYIVVDNYQIPLDKYNIPYSFIIIITVRNRNTMPITVWEWLKRFTKG
jgi:hypothetical protein